MMPAISLHKLRVANIHKQFGLRAVLRGIGLMANAGDVVSIIGSSGSGKSTFLRCINLLEQARHRVAGLIRSSPVRHRRMPQAPQRTRPFMTDDPTLGALYGSAAISTFLGLPACPDLDRLTAHIALIGAPCASPYASVGAYCRHAPDVLRAATTPLSANLRNYDFDSGGPLFPKEGLTAVDCGNLPFVESDGAANRETIRRAIATIRERGAVPVVLGGDDSIPIPVLHGLAGDGKLTILQIDAHIDRRDEHMGERQGLSSTMRRASEMSHIERIVQVGARGIGSARPEDVQDACNWGVRFISARELHRKGVAAALDLIPEGSNIVVSLDADAFDPSLVPAVIGRSPGGLSYDQVVDLIRGASELGRIVAINFVEFMPERDVDGLGALTFARVIMTALGILARQVEDREAGA